MMVRRGRGGLDNSKIVMSLIRKVTLPPLTPPLRRRGIKRMDYPHGGGFRRQKPLGFEIV